ncbi:MAG TPA: FkbM family methyltransferase [Candidatus Limnocylindrales bacterium]|nr:FkbM family methyltransferase [Candidatus Limnocylindrales bacterium]
MYIPPLVEAGARLGFGYARNQYGLRDRRPPSRFISRTISFLAARRESQVVETEMSGLQVLVSTSDRTIARSVYTSGDWDPLLVGSVFRALDAIGEPYRGRTFLEVGANFGVYALPAVAEYGFARAVAYEPDPVSFELLERNIERNGLGDRVSAHNAALSSSAGQLTLKLGSRNAGDNRIVAGADDEPDTVSVPARTFDEEVAAGRIPLSDLGLVWLDVQGHEREVLLGANTLLASDAPMVMEYATAMVEPKVRRQLDELIADCFDVMVDIGWSTLTDRVRFQPASAVRDLAPNGRAVETDLLLLHRRDRTA